MAPGKKHDRTARLNRICQLLYEYPHGLRPDRLAELCEVSTRTVFRDLQAIQRDREYPIWQEEGRYGLEQRAFLPPLKLTLPEAMTLFLAARLVSRYSDERDPTIVAAFGKLAAVLPRPVAQHVSETVRGMLARQENPHFARVFDLLAEAWAQGRRVRIWYPWTGEGATKVYERLVEPYFIETLPHRALLLPDRLLPPRRGPQDLQAGADQADRAHRRGLRDSARFRRQRLSQGELGSGRGRGGGGPPSFRARRRLESEGVHLAPLPVHRREIGREPGLRGDRGGHHGDNAVDPLLGRRGRGAGTRGASVQGGRDGLADGPPLLDDPLFRGVAGALLTDLRTAG